MTRSSYEASLEQRHRRLEQGRRNRGGVNPTSVKGDRLCPPHFYSSPPGFLGLPTALSRLESSNVFFSWGNSFLYDPHSAAH